MKKKLKAKTIGVKELTKDQILEMFQLFSYFYEGVSFNQFCSDLEKKTCVILMHDNNQKIKGFSTLYDFDHFYNQKNYRILYSGDTIISPEHWGTSVLTVAFLKKMVKLKLRYPTRPVWYFLISKGYKTYLLMANNFIKYYPRYDLETPPYYRELLATLAEKIYPGCYNQTRGTIEFPTNSHERLKTDIAPITDELKKTFPKINFFEEMNPGWHRGDELACLGEIDLRLGILHPIKILKKWFKKSL